MREQRAEGVRFRRSLTLVGLTLVAPGSAQFTAGNRQLGKVVLQVWAGLLVVGALVLWLVPADDLAGLVVRPWLLTLLKLALLAVGVGWVSLLVDAWRLGHPPALSRKHRLIMVGATLALAALVATPFIMVARYASAAHEAVVSLFPSGEQAVASNGRLNFLLLGADAGKGRDGVRPDSITLVSVDVRSGRPVMVSLPRNLENARFAEGTPAAAEFPDGFSGEGERTEWMLNATWTYGEAHPELFAGPDGPGVTAVQQAVEGTLGLDVHYYMVVDLAGFQDLVDALGGIAIRVNEEIPIGEKGRVLEPGQQKLDGYETLWYARSRTGSSDYARMARQRCVLGAILREADPSAVLRNFTELAEASTSLITTNIPQQLLPDLVGVALEAKGQPVTSLQLVPPLVAPADPDIGAIHELVDDAIAASGEREPEAAQSEPVTPAATAAADVEAPENATEQTEPTVGLEDVCAYE